jgi:hypothetical protein
VPPWHYIRLPLLVNICCRPIDVLTQPHYPSLIHSNSAMLRFIDRVAPFQYISSDDGFAVCTIQLPPFSFIFQINFLHLHHPQPSKYRLYQSAAHGPMSLPTKALLSRQLLRMYPPELSVLPVDLLSVFEFWRLQLEQKWIDDPFGINCFVCEDLWLPRTKQSQFVLCKSGFLKQFCPGSFK